MESSDETRALLTRTAELAADFLESLEQRPVCANPNDVAGAAVRPAYRGHGPARYT